MTDSPMQVLTLGDGDRAAALHNLNRWLASQGETERAPADTPVEAEKIPGTLCLTLALPSGRVVTGLLDLGHDYNTPGELWPWSWR